MHKASIQNILELIHIGFSDLNNHLKRNLKIKEHNNTKLMIFQETINNLNHNIHYDLQKRSQLLQSKNTLMYRNEIRANISKIYLHLITYISLWSINLWQGMINKDTINKSIGLLLAEEHIILSDKLNLLLSKKGYYYADAVNCLNLFKLCEDKYFYKSFRNN